MRACPFNTLLKVETPAMRIAIVGAGMAGLSCADALSAVGCEVTLLDKGRGPGGRMSTRRLATPLGEVAFDHGAQYFTARAPGFRAQVKAWEQRGVVARWPLPAPDAWVGTPGMNAVIKAMAGRHDVRWQIPVDRIEWRGGKRGEGWRLDAGKVSFTGFDGVVLAVPAEQALPFLSLHDFAMAREVMLARSQPCWTAMFAFADRVPGTVDMLRDAGPIGWAARSNAKPGRSGVEGWVVQARADWSMRHLEYPVGEIAALLFDELAAALGEAMPELAMPELIGTSAHRWRYAMSAGLGLGSLWNAENGLGVCGDWLLGPRIECAWLSGQELARQILDVPPGAEHQVR